MKISFYIIVIVVFLTTFSWGYFKTKFDVDDMSLYQDQESKYALNFTREIITEKDNEKEDAYSLLLQELKERITRHRDNEEDIKKILSELDSYPADRTRENLKYNLSMFMAEDHPALALILWIQLNIERIESGYGMPDGIREWLESNTEDALDFYDKHKKLAHTSGYESILSSIAYGFAQKSPGKAWIWMHSLSSREQKASVEGFINSILEHQPDQLSKYLIQIKDGGLDRMSMAAFSKKFAEIDFESARAWMNQLPEHQQYNYMSNVYATICHDETKVQALMETLPEEERSPLVEAMSMHLLNNKSHHEAAEWIWDTRDQNQKLETTVRNLVYHWAYTDAQELQQWMETLELGKFRDYAIVGFVNIEASDILSLSKLIETISPTNESRIEVIRNFSHRWAKSDQEAALKWLESIKLPEEERGMIKATFTK